MDLITNRLDFGFQKRIHKLRKIKWCEMLFPNRVARFVARNIAPLTEKSCLSSLNGLDLEQMSPLDFIKYDASVSCGDESPWIYLHKHIN